MVRSTSARVRLLRCTAPAAVALALLAADGVQAAVAKPPAGRYDAQCRRLTRQIDHFESVAKMARDRGDRLWFDGTVAHMQRLADRRERLCPEEKPNYVLMMTKWFGKAAKAAGRAALRYLTFGAY